MTRAAHALFIKSLRFFKAKTNSANNNLVTCITINVLNSWLLTKPNLLTLVRKNAQVWTLEIPCGLQQKSLWSVDGLQCWSYVNPLYYVSLARMEKRGQNQFFLPRHTAKLSILPSSFGMPLQKLYLGAQDLLLYLQVYLSDQSSKNWPYSRILP